MSGGDMPLLDGALAAARALVAAARRLGAHPLRDEACLLLDAALPAAERARDAGALARAVYRVQDLACQLLAARHAPPEFAALAGQALAACLDDPTRFAAFDAERPPPLTGPLLAVRGAALRRTLRAPFVPAASPQREAEPPQPDAPPDLPVPKIALVTVARTVPAQPLPELYRAVVEGCLDRIAGLASARLLQAFGERAEAERSLDEHLDAIAAVGGRVANWIFDYGLVALGSPSPWPLSACAFALACLEGGDVLGALGRLAELVPEDMPDKLDAFAEALSAAPHPRLAELCAGLLRSPAPSARAVALARMSRCGALSPDRLRMLLLGDASAAVQRAALEALGRAPAEDAEPLLALASARLSDPRRAVAHAAARALLQHGRSEPWDALAVRAPLRDVLGPAALEIAVRAAAPLEPALVDGIVARAPMSAELLEALGRLGRPDTAPFIAHYLGDEDLADAALAALGRMLGDAVDPERLLDPTAWRAAAATRDPAVRLRFGEPWSAQVVLERCAGGALACRTIVEELEELATRSGEPFAISSWAFAPRPDEELRALLPRGAVLDRKLGVGGFWAPRPRQPGRR